MNYCYLYFIVIIKNMNKIPIEMKNGFILIQDIKNETTESFANLLYFSSGI